MSDFSVKRPSNVSGAAHWKVPPCSYACQLVWRVWGRPPIACLLTRRRRVGRRLGAMLREPEIADLRRPILFTRARAQEVVGPLNKNYLHRRDENVHGLEVSVLDRRGVLVESLHALHNAVHQLHAQLRGNFDIGAFVKAFRLRNRNGELSERRHGNE